MSRALAAVFFAATTVPCGGWTDGGRPVSVVYTNDTAVGESSGVADLALVIEAVELEPCFDVARRWRPGPSMAYAHTLATPTRIGVPYLLDLTNTDEVAAGELRARGAAFCSVRVYFGPADDDTVGIDERPWMEGLTVALAASDDADPWDTGLRFDVSLPLDETATTLLEQQSTEPVFMVLSVDAQAALEDLPPDALDAYPDPQVDDPAANALLQSIARSIRVSLVEDRGTAKGDG